MRSVAQIAAVLLLVAMLVPIPLVSAQPLSGSRITFADVATGTTGPIPGLDITGNGATDAVVLDGALWLMYRDSDHSRLASYHPQFSSSAWNLSFEAYAPRTGNSYSGMDPGQIGLRAMVSGEGGSTLGIELCVGNRSSEGIYLLVGQERTRISSGLLPAYPSGNASDGGRPDRYVISFENAAGSLKIVVRHTVAGLLYKGSLPFTARLPVLDLFSDSDVKQVLVEGQYLLSVNGGWMVDDFTVRPVGSAYPTIPEVWCTTDRAEPVRIGLFDEAGTLLDASVRIGDHPATRTEASYAAYYDRSVAWNVPTYVDITMGSMTFRELLQVSTTTTVDGARVANWWGGYDWASVFGTDDCSGFSTVAAVYQGFDHPLTAYVQSSSGRSADILASQSELAMHQPHDFLGFKRMTWSEAVSVAKQSHEGMEQQYTFASRWDDPSYVGRGDTYISMANPGSAATYEVMFAQYLRGTRIEGSSSGQGSTIPGNFSLYGSWWVQDSAWWDSSNHSWQPARPMDMLDAQRQCSTDRGNAPWSTVLEVAARGGLLRVYNHQQSSPMLPAAVQLLNWIVNPKTDSAYENWKATDGEAASYVYARHTTSLAVNSSFEMGYDVQRQDPRDAGYWLVPVTVSVDLGSRQVRSVKVIEHTSQGDVIQELKPLNGKRTMEIGYDIRNGAVQVSAFFNASATIIIEAASGDPHITNRPAPEVFSGETYSYLAVSTASPSGRPLQWTFDNASAPWMQGAAVGDHSFLVSGTAVNGTFHLSLGVSDGFRNDVLNWTVKATTRLFLKITSVPDRICAAGLYYQYQATCTGATGWRLEGEAYWLVVDSNGRVHGYAPADEKGKDVHIRLVATTGQLTAAQNFTMHVNADPADNPKVMLPFIGITIIMALLLVLLLSYAFGKK